MIFISLQEPFRKRLVAEVAAPKADARSSASSGTRTALILPLRARRSLSGRGWWRRWRR